jgi:hypothetical protein
MKFTDFEVVLTPAVVSTVLLAYQFIFSEAETELSTSTSTFVPLDCQQMIDPAKIWFLPRPTGSDVDTMLSAPRSYDSSEFSMSMLDAKDEDLSIEIPNISIKFETHAFYGRSANTVALPLFLVRSQGNVEMSLWSSELKIELNLRLVADVFHETRSGYEKLLEPIEPRDPMSDQFQWFDVDLTYKNFSKRTRSQFQSDFQDDDEFEHVERLPKQQLIIRSGSLFNLNISNETIHVFNQMQSVFSESLTELEKTSSLTRMSGTTIASSLSQTEIKAPISIVNETEHDITLTAPSSWKDFDPNEKYNSSFTKQETTRRLNAVTNQASFISTITVEKSGCSDERHMYNLSCAPLHFQLRDPKNRGIYKVRDKQQLIKLSPSGFTNRQVDVASHGEKPLLFLSNTDPNLKVILIVNVEGVAGLRKISVRSAITVQNHLPFPVELFPSDSMGDTVSLFIPDHDTLQQNPSAQLTIPVRLFSSSQTFSIKLADPQIRKSLKLIDYTINKIPIDEGVNTDHEFFLQNEKSPKYFANVHLKRTKFTKSPLSKLTMIIRPCFVVQNWLPYP